jgi:DNA sulfur modification protein DndD
MKFVSLRMKNWRSLHGENEIQFSTDPDKPLTLIFGRSGSGKTALLNAFTWVIYGDFTEGFSRRNDLINHEALSSDSDATAIVELHFDHEKNKYTISRTVTASQQSEGKNDVFISCNGNTETEGAIHAFLPPALKDIFFFPGETFGNANLMAAKGSGGSSQSLNIDKAIKSLLAGDIYEHSVHDLKVAVNSAALKGTNASTDKVLNRAEQAYQEAQAKLTEAESVRDRLPSDLEEAQQAAAEAAREAQQYDSKAIEEFNAARDELASAVGLAEQQVTACKALFVELANIAHGAFAGAGVKSAIAQLDMAERIGLIPLRIDGEVLANTLKNDVCSLCGEDLSQEGREHVLDHQARSPDPTTAVKSLEDRALLKNYVRRSEESLSQLRVKVDTLSHQFKNVPSPGPNSGIAHLRATILQCTNHAAQLLTQHKQRMAEFDDQRSSDDNSTSIIERSIRLEYKVKEIEARMAQNAEVVAEYQEQRKSAWSSYETAAAGAKEAQQRIKAITLIKEVTEFFEFASNGLAKYGRIDFELAINQVLGTLMGKAYNVRVASDFRISVFSATDDQEIAPSQGEKVLLLLSFLGAMAQLAPQYQTLARGRQQFSGVGTVNIVKDEGFPVVIDAPLSALDVGYEKSLMEALPKLLPQVIVPVNNRSVDGWETVASSIGRVYVLELTAVGQQDDFIRWNGKDHVFTRSDDEVTTRTKIVEIG